MPNNPFTSLQLLTGLLVLVMSHTLPAENLLPKTQSSLVDSLASEPEFLPVDQAFMLIANKKDGRLHFSWTIADGYYLYQHRTRLTPLDRTDQVIPLRFPAGTQKHDEYFGDVTAYYHGLDISVAPDSGADWTDNPSQALLLVYQGCADAGLCYPPQKRAVSFDARGNILLSNIE